MLHFLDVVAGIKNGHSLFLQVMDNLPKTLTGRRIHARRWLIQKEQLGLADQADDKGQEPLLTTR